MQAVMRYPGSKWGIADWIVDFFPEHHSYLEAFFGSGAVLFNKPRSNIETVNDLDGNVVNLFEWIRKDPEKLAHEIYYTPYARQVYEQAFSREPEESFEKAVNFYICLNMGHGFRTTGEKVGWKNDIQGRERAYAAQGWSHLPERIYQAAERLRGVQIENKPAVEVIQRFNFPNVIVRLKFVGEVSMKIGLIDVDGHHFPNLPLMKLSAWHKRQGDTVVWYEQMKHGFPYKPLDRVYMSKIFSFTPDYPYYVNAEEIVRGGSGYCIKLAEGKEIYHRKNDPDLPEEIEHIYPDYSLYPELTKDTAYGFMSRGCPRGCAFCHVGSKEGKQAYKAAELPEFWRGQKNIVLLDPNLLACREWRDILRQLIDSHAWVDFSQGLDIRLMTEEKAELIKQVKTKNIHFAWDRYEDRDWILPKLKTFKELTKLDKRKLSVYVLTNFDTTLEQDLERIYTLRDIGYTPYVMIYNKQSVKKGTDLRRLQRWVNSKVAFAAVRRFEEFI